MHILHGTWIPEAIDGFVQQGDFYLWVETTETTRRRKSSSRDSQNHPSPNHPSHLTNDKLVEFLTSELGIKPGTYERLENSIVPQYFLLPSHTDRPLPSWELTRYLEEDPTAEFEWQYWQIDCYAVPLHGSNQIIRLLNDIHFIALNNLADCQLGTDLFFWYHYTQAFRTVLLKDQYIPALKYRSLATQKATQKATQSAKKRNASTKSQDTDQAVSKTTRSAKTKRSGSAMKVATPSTQIAPAPIAPTKSAGAAVSEFEIYPGWEIISEHYDDLIKRYVEYMPIACVNGFAIIPDTPQFYDREQILRHFSECLLTELVVHTPSSTAFDKKIEDSLIYHCLYPGQPWTGAVALQTYQQWQTWRDRISRSQLDLPFHLYFQLHAPESREDSWFLEFLVATRADPSHRVSLIDYWQFGVPKKKSFQKKFGETFEQNLLTNLGYAARIYQKLWNGLETDEPFGVRLTTDEAAAFLQEQAWVLEEAGYRVIVPAWWTPKGRQRAKVRLQASGRKVTNNNKAKSYFSFATLVDYQYELSIDGQPVSEKEWRELVNAKTSLVQFRGQWMELDRDQMKQMLEFWEKHKEEHPELSLMEFMKLVAQESNGIELEVSQDELLSEMMNRLQDKSNLEALPDLVQFQGQLREYQKRGVAWVHYLESLGFNGCLADDMGLGKSAQVIARLVYEREQLSDDALNDRTNGKTNRKTSRKTNSETQEKTVSGKKITGKTTSKSTSKSASKSASKATGKTSQVKAPLDDRPVDDTANLVLPTLLIAPTSVVGNWQKEIEKFAPHLRSLIHHGSDRTQDPEAFQQLVANCDVVITSFTLARKDEKLLSHIDWQRIVIDEAQNIKNPKAAQTKAILKLAAPHRLALTGTPVENRLLDLWSIFNFLNPGYLGKETHFRQSFEVPIQKNNDTTRSLTLKKLVEPFILRRVKTDPTIIQDLPDKVEQKLFCNLTKEQASLYEAVVKDVERQLQEAEGIQRKGLILATLLKLKQVCNHPRQFLQDGSDFTPDRSHKLERLVEMIQEVMAEGESLLVFTQFTEIGEALEKYIKHTLHYNTYYLHGGTNRNKREKMIAEFQDPETEPSIFILSLKAGGVGITLTKANHVFHYDRWWNPAVENQATDRAFRIGQTKNVFVHKFVAIGTLEERIDQMIEDKKKLANAIVGSDESWLTELDNESFKQLIALNRNAVLD